MRRKVEQFKVEDFKDAEEEVAAAVKKVAKELNRSPSLDEVRQFKPNKYKEVDEEPQAFDDLVVLVKAAYESGTTMEEAERHAARFLEAQMNIAAELAKLDLDARMKKNGMKAAKAQVYIDLCAATEKKPSDIYLEQQVALSKIANTAVDLYEHADARRENLMLYLGIFKDAHIYFRGIAKGGFSG
jgi:hypothetical protein